jgi:hypothetical protein
MKSNYKKARYLKTNENEKTNLHSAQNYLGTTAATTATKKTKTCIALRLPWIPCGGYNGNIVPSLHQSHQGVHYPRTHLYIYIIYIYNVCLCIYIYMHTSIEVASLYICTVTYIYIHIHIYI